MIKTIMFVLMMLVSVNGYCGDPEEGETMLARSSLVLWSF